MVDETTIGELSVRRIGYGCMALTGPGGWGEPPNLDSARAVLRRAVELGVQLFDTADSYGPEISETLIAEALSPYQDGVVIATKGGFVREGPWQLRGAGRPDQLRRALAGSLARLRLDRIDLYQLHTVDSAVPLEQSVGTLAELRSEGKVGPRRRAERPRLEPLRKGAHRGIRASARTRGLAALPPIEVPAPQGAGGEPVMRFAQSTAR
jgi:aryl-alcohol dehydrogenase-like predicted oxidoreductase